MRISPRTTSLDDAEIAGYARRARGGYRLGFHLVAVSVLLESLRRKTRTETALYVGDDQTDEDVFALDQPNNILGIRVGHGASTHAPYYLRDQSEVDLLLTRLARLRS